jgi:hypothetical protein
MTLCILADIYRSDEHDTIVLRMEESRFCPEDGGCKILCNIHCYFMFQITSCHILEDTNLNPYFLLVKVVQK